MAAMCKYLFQFPWLVLAFLVSLFNFLLIGFNGKRQPKEVWRKGSDDGHRERVAGLGGGKQRAGEKRTSRIVSSTKITLKKEGENIVSYSSEEAFLANILRTVCTFSHTHSTTLMLTLHGFFTAVISSNQFSKAQGQLILILSLQIIKAID